MEKKKEKPTLELLVARRLLIMALWREIKAKKKQPQQRRFIFRYKYDYWQMED